MFCIIFAESGKTGQFVFSPGGHTAPDVALGTVPVQKLPDLSIEGRGCPGQHVAQILVDCGFGDPEFHGDGAHGSAGLDHVHSDLTGSCIVCVCHTIPPGCV